MLVGDEVLLLKPLLASLSVLQTRLVPTGVVPVCSASRSTVVAGHMLTTGAPTPEDAGSAVGQVMVGAGGIVPLSVLLKVLPVVKP